MDLLKAKQIRSIMQEVENAVISSGSTSSEEEDRERSVSNRRESGASQERWAESITSSSIGPSIWGSQVLLQDRGRASRSASFSVGQEQSNVPIANSSHDLRGPREAVAYDQTRLLREQFQQMKFKNRSKSSYAAAWHVPEFDTIDSSDNAILDEDELGSRLKYNDPPGLTYTTPSNPRFDTFRDVERRASLTSNYAQQNVDQARYTIDDSVRREIQAVSSRDSSNHSTHELMLGQHVSSSQGKLQNTTVSSNLLADVDRYFSSDDHRTRTRTHLAQTAAAQSVMMTQGNTLTPSGPLYIVEFKACRTDFFCVAEGSGLEVHIGDLVIVEADRGRDLGKVIREDVTLSQVRALKAQQAREQAMAMGGLQDESEKTNVNNIQPKLIYRLSQPSEIAMLLVKNQDEQQAMLVCQAKVRQRKLPMEVLDGEYQWDRRKLTFYYYASQRIDFRELVRDLFKIYKTRIWMCASNPTSVTNANISLGAPGAVGQAKTIPSHAQTYSNQYTLSTHNFNQSTNKGSNDIHYSTYTYPQQQPDYPAYSPYMPQVLY